MRTWRERPPQTGSHPVVPQSEWRKQHNERRYGSPSEDLAQFPAVALPAEQTLYRIHKRKNHPEHFGDTGLYRFDPPPDRANDFGVCYLASEAIGAYIEVLGKMDEVFRRTLSRRRLSEASIASDLRLANLTDPAAESFGVDESYSTGSEEQYSPTQALSAGLFDAGFEGVFYYLRGDEAMRQTGVALFGPKDVQSWVSPISRWSTARIPADTRQVGIDFGITVIRRPNRLRLKAWLNEGERSTS